MNENAVFFSAPGIIKKKVLKSNEWMVNELFREQKKTENLPEIFWKRQKIYLFFFSRVFGKKKHNQLLLKKIGIRQKSE